MKMKPISSELESYVEKLKETPLPDYAMADLQLIVEELVDKYKATKVKSERRLLETLYTKVITSYNTRAKKLHRWPSFIHFGYVKDIVPLKVELKGH